MSENEFKPDYNIETVIMGKTDVNRISEALAEIDSVSSNIEDARAINKLVLECQNLICNWTCPKN